MDRVRQGLRISVFRLHRATPGLVILINPDKQAGHSEAASQGCRSIRSEQANVSWICKASIGVGVSLMSNLAYRPDGFWRRLIAVVLVHAVAVQALLVALGGFSLTANAEQRPPAFEMCSHSADGTTQSPAKIPDHSACTHCIFCFAGAHHAVIGAAPAVFHRVNVAMAVVPSLDDASGPKRLTRYTIASPRGPPLSA